MGDRFDSKSIFTILACAVASAAAVWMMFYALDRRSGPSIVIEPVSSEIAVSVNGAVATPGVYTLSDGARINDAIVAAGGLTVDADASGLNLAARLDDEQRIDVPAIGRPEQSGAELASSPVAVADGIRAPTPVVDTAGLIDINSASAESLETLPEIGPAIAARIVEYRETNGPFRTVEELARVEGISPRMVDALRALIVALP